jgi:hypothetical protein
MLPDRNYDRKWLHCDALPALVSSTVGLQNWNGFGSYVWSFNPSPLFNWIRRTKQS